MRLEPFSTGPEEKGIETRMRAPKPSLPVRSALALKKKGLRPFHYDILRFHHSSSALALKKKGLRRYARRSCLATHFCSALALKKKGLRLPFSNIILSVFRSALALKKKGLRRELRW